MNPKLLCCRANIILLLAFFDFLSSAAYAQLNLKTGYSFSILSNPGLDQVISDFNQSQSYSSSISNLRWLQGFEVGLRYKAGIHALELTYQDVYNSLTAIGQTAGTGVAYKDKLKFSVQSAAIGYQLGDGLIALGTDVQYQWYFAKYLPGITTDKFRNVQEMIGFKFYLMLTLEGNQGIDMAVQPYMVLPTKYYDLNPLAQALGTEETLGQDKWIRFGITLMFYNGPVNKD